MLKSYCAKCNFVWNLRKSDHLCKVHIPLTELQRIKLCNHLIHIHWSNLLHKKGVEKEEDSNSEALGINELHMVKNSGIYCLATFLIVVRYFRKVRKKAHTTNPSPWLKKELSA